MQHNHNTIQLMPLAHRGQMIIGIYFPGIPVLQSAVRKTAGIRWSQTNRCWYIPLQKSFYADLLKNIRPVARVNNVALKEYLMACKKPEIPGVSATRQSSFLTKQGLKPVAGIREANAAVLASMRQTLVLKAYSPSTIRTYQNEMSQFLQTLKNTPADTLGTDRIKSYLQYCFEKLQLSENTLHSRINALKFYYEQVLRKEKFFWEIPRPKKPMQLPKIPGEDELSNLFAALSNIKHKAMLFTAYSAGLRVSEIVKLKIKDIDGDRMQIFIEEAKGKKDRYVGLSIVLLDILRSYVKAYKPRPQIYLFESEQTGAAYPTRTVQRIFQLARQKAGITKTVGIHSLRHSFATHLLEKGVDIKYIKDLLGHFNIKTTERYLHVTKTSLVNIVSPLDDLWEKGKIKW